MLIEAYMPECDACERHHVQVRAPAERVYAAIRTADLAASPITRLLLALRALPSVLLRGRAALQELRTRAPLAVRLEDFERQGFSVLDENPPHELLIGLEGRFWRPTGGLRIVERTTFHLPPPAGLARAAWNFSIEPEADGGCRLSTETRVRCSDARTRRRFRLYWALIRPGSGLIRRQMLRAIRSAAESPRAGS